MSSRFVAVFAFVIAVATIAVPGRAQTTTPADVPWSIALAPIDSAPEVEAEAGLARSAILARLRAAYGERSVVDGARPDASVAMTLRYAHAFGTNDLAVTVVDAKAKIPIAEHFRFPDPAAPATAARLVSLVDRASAPVVAAGTAPTVVDLQPIESASGLHDLAVEATALLASRIHDASGATVVVRSASDVATASAGGTPIARMIVTGAIAHNGSAYELRTNAFAADRTALGSLQVLVRDATSFPGSPVFAPFVTTSLDAAPQLPSNVSADVTVLPLESEPELAEAAALARVALVDRMIAGGIVARASDSASGSASFTGTFARKGSGYRLELVGHTSKNSGTVTTVAELAAPALLPPTTAIVALVDSAKAASPAPERRFVFVPFENPSDKDGYIGFANLQYAKALAEHGYAVAAERGLDPVDARLTAPELCKRDAADAILLGTHIDHDQIYHKGALRTFGSFLGFFTFGLGNAAVNALGNIASDDRYVSHANLAATLVDCNGKHLWNKTVQGGNSHYGRNAAAGGSGAISDAVERLVTSMFAETPFGSEPAAAAQAP